MKECSKCQKLKQLTDFRKDNNGKHGRRGKCKDCESKTIKRLDRRTSLAFNYLKDIPVENLSNFEKVQATNNSFFTLLKYTKPITNLDELVDDIIVSLTLLSKQTDIKVSFEIDTIMKNKEAREFIISHRIDKKGVNEWDIKSFVVSNLKSLIDNISEHNYQESGLSFVGYTNFLMYVNPNVVAVGGTFIDLPKKIKETQACINIQNQDNKCFLWCIIAHFHLKEHKVSNPSKIYHYKKSPFLNHLNTSTLIYPTPISCISTFEIANNLSINVYKLSEIHSEENTNYPISLTYQSINKNASETINLLLFKSHFVLIKNFNRLLTHTLKGNNSAFSCYNCGISYFTSKKALKRHIDACAKDGESLNYTLPEKKFIKFENYQNQFYCPFVIYADFESILKKTDKPSTTQTSFEKEHTPIAFALKTICRENETYSSDLITYVGTDSDVQFINYLNNELKRIEALMKVNIPLKCFTAPKNQNCFICSISFTPDDQVVKDHNHLNGEFRGYTHSACNLKFTKLSTSVPVIFHNLEGYDIHLFIDALAKKATNLNVIPKSKEKYLAVSAKLQHRKLTLKFLDSLHFFGGSLASNASKLSSFKYSTDSMLRSKQFFPYSFLNSFEALSASSQEIFQRQSWYNDLDGSYASDNEINHARHIFETYNCQTLQDYMLIYLKTDVLLLADIFEHFRFLAMETYTLDPACYFTT